MSSKYFPVLLLAAAFARGQTQPATASAPEPEKDKDVVKLDSMVVSSGADPKTAFDLAQGTSILAGDSLRERLQATLGETLAASPGVSSTYYGPAASRPVIRGLGDDRIRVLTNSVGSLDVSDISPDHNTAVEPLFAQRVEVLRGPSTLLYGSSAVGGVVNVIDNRIPTDPGDGTLHGAGEGRIGGSSDERAGALALNSGNARTAWQVDFSKQRTDDTRIPGVARIDADAPPVQPRGTLPDSALDTWSGSLGATAFGSAGKIGASISQYETVYGTPTGDDPPVTINMKQTRFDLAAELTQPFGIFRGAKLKAGYGRYRHAELDGDEIGTQFNNRAFEGRLELPHEAIGGVTGTLGAQFGRNDFAAVGEEVVTPPSLTSNAALFALEEYKTEHATYQFGARYEHQSITLGTVSLALPALPGFSARSGQRKIYDGPSASIGVVTYPAKDWSVGASLAYTERLPSSQELFSNGPHGGTAAYEVGTSSLSRERSLGLDLSVRRRAGFATGSASLFANRFSGYIYEQQLPDGTVPLTANPDDLTPYQFVAKDALFYGAEAEVSLHLIEGKEHSAHLDFSADTVRAEQTTDHVALPRIPPWHAATTLTVEVKRWKFGTELRIAGAQNHPAPLDTRTAGYALLHADINYNISSGRLSHVIFLRGDNLTDATARASTSFLKDRAPLPGRGVTFGVRTEF